MPSTTPKSKTCGRCDKRKPLNQFTSVKGRFCGPCRKGTRNHAAVVRRDVRIKETYDISQEEYERLLEYQGGVCAGCLEPRKANLDIDHCHKGGHIRMLLCRRCNRKVLPYAKDKPDTLRRLADMLEDPPAVRLLGIRLHSDFRKES